MREGVRALLGEVQGPCPARGSWPAHCLRLSRQAGACRGVWVHTEESLVGLDPAPPPLINYFLVILTGG